MWAACCLVLRVLLMLLHLRGAMSESSADLV